MIRRLDVPHHGVRARREEVRAACRTGNARRRHGRHDVTAVRPRADKRTGRTLKRVRPVFASVPLVIFLLNELCY